MTPSQGPMQDTRRTQQWINWAGTARCSPRAIVAPPTPEAAREAVLDAVGRGEGVRVVGAGHSFTPAVTTNGTLLSLDMLNALESVTRLPGGDSLVTVGAGIRLYALNSVLASLGLAMPNLGDIDRQSLAGALNTGTHGTGARLTGLADQVRGVRVLTAAGDIVEADSTHERELFEAARLGLGALGVLLAVTVRVVPAFTLVAEEEPWHLDRVIEGLTGPGNLIDGNDHFEFYWFPHTTQALTKRNNRVVGSEQGTLGGPTPRPLSRRRRWVDDELLSNGLFAVTNEIAALAPRTTPHVNRGVVRALSARAYTAPSPEVFVSPRRVRFAEMEYAIERSDVVEVLAELSRWIESSGERVSFPVEVRFAAPDDVWLSTAHGRESAYIAVHQYARVPHSRYFAGVEAIMRAAGGRPHWGKLHTLGSPDLAELYPRFGDFQRVRSAYDPSGVFTNAYVRRLFG